MFYNIWKTEYKAHSIIVENSWIGPTKLFVDGKLVDETVGLLATKLMGKINDESLKVAVNSGLLSVSCKI